MKKFKFSLEQVLRLKDSQKKQLEQEIAGLDLQRHHLEQHLEKLNEEWMSEKRAINESKKKMVAAELRMRNNYLEFLDQKIEIEKKSLLNLQREITQKREKYVGMIQEIKVLMKLREKRMEEYALAMNREEQAMNDEVSSQQFAKRHAGSVAYKRYVM